MTVTSTHAPTWNTQRPSGMPFHRYRPAHDRVEVPLTARTWPSNRITAAPLWVPTDLRDGNQALVEPMDPDRKMRAFALQVAMGFTEIEVGYPSASQLDLDFVRRLADDDLVPEDVTIVVFTAARADLIARTFESVRGLPRAVIHMYAATAPAWRDVVLGRDRADLKSMILQAGQHVLAEADRMPATATRFQFSPEVFNLTEPDYVLEVCNAMSELWDASPDRPVIHNLPATVEIGTPNIYADQIEWMDRHLDRRDSVILSVHPHNDRGTGVACAELAMLAGAQRVEGCLFGNGERTGNVDLVTLALNLLTQGVDPMIDLSDIDRVRREVEHYNQLPVHERHPYAGDLVHTAFSGTHQDAIRKGIARHVQNAAAAGTPATDAPWEVPYLPIDPADIGRSYDAVIRVNSQSGKGGIAYLLSTERGLELPRRLQIEFSRVVQELSENALAGGEVTADALWQIFQREYLEPADPLRLLTFSVDKDAFGTHTVALRLSLHGVEHRVTGSANGPLLATTEALAAVGVETEVLDYSEQATGSGQHATAAAYVEVRAGGRTTWGVGLDPSLLTSSVQALLSGVTRALRD